MNYESAFCSVSGPKHLLDVLEAISDVVDWQDLGLKLGLKESQLEIIDLNCQKDVEKCREKNDIPVDGHGQCVVACACQGPSISTSGREV